MATVVPEKGQTREVAKKLLALTDDPNDIRTTADGPDGVTFIVPDDLYDKFMDDEEQAPAEVVDEEAPAPMRRGRPPGSKNKPKAENEE